jgi:hypothetical protein
MRMENGKSVARDLLVLKGPSGKAFALAPCCEVQVGDLVDITGTKHRCEVIDVICPVSPEFLRFLRHCDVIVHKAVHVWTGRSLVKEEADDS